MSARIEIILELLSEMRVTTDSILSPEDLRTRRSEANRVIAERRGIAPQSVLDTYREQLGPHVDGVAQFDDLLNSWLRTGDERLRTVLLSRSDAGDRPRVESYFNRHAYDTAPSAIDLSEPTGTARVATEVYRIIRDTPAARALKALHEHICQICGSTINLSGGGRYSEVHHIRPLGAPHEGPDIRGNMLVLCPNDHARCDFGAIRLDLSQISTRLGHELAAEYVEYHNSRVYRAQP